MLYVLKLLMHALDYRAWVEIHRTGMPARVGVHACTPCCKIRQVQWLRAVVQYLLLLLQGCSSVSIDSAFLLARGYAEVTKVSTCNKHTGMA